MNHKVLVLSHESDIDGINCVILAKLAFKDLEYMLFTNVEKLEYYVREKINHDEVIDYKEIYITDLALYDPALSLIDKTNLKNKVHIFDHHQKAIDDKMNRYPFVKIIEEDETGKRCGTDLFYEYLRKKNLIVKKEIIKEFVELTRLEDTWEWKKNQKNGEKAHDLAILLNAVGIEKYISLMFVKLLKDEPSFEFDKQEKEWIQNKKIEYEKKLISILSTMEISIDENGDKFGVLFADYEYRNELSEYLRKNGNSKEIKYVTIIAINKGEYGQKSYRSIDPNYDVNKIASNHGGGGHKNAASVSISKEQKEKSLTMERKEALFYLINCSYKKDL